MRKPSTPLTDRIAGAPASWGICEVPGWGHQLSPARVLADMREAGLRATELGPEGFLPGQPQEQRTLLESFGVQPVGAFCPLVLHGSEATLRQEVRGILRKLVTIGAETMVIAAATGETGYDGRLGLGDDQWRTLLRNLGHVQTLAAEQNVRTCLHPHIGTAVESRTDVHRVLDGSDIPLCADTGHLLVGGTDPVTLARDVPGRISHVHLKDVNPAVLGSVRSGKRSYTEGVREGMYTPLGQGSVDLREIISSLEGSGYQGWYVFEQDRALAAEPKNGGLLSDARASIQFLRGLS